MYCFVIYLESETTKLIWAIWQWDKKWGRKLISDHQLFVIISWLRKFKTDHQLLLVHPNHGNRILVYLYTSRVLNPPKFKLKVEDFVTLKIVDEWLLVKYQKFFWYIRVLGPIRFRIVFLWAPWMKHRGRHFCP